ncbi:tetratricopeptide repeat protein [bacterium]|nr:tetratricopeptide repeat protein [bacterium]
MRKILILVLILFFCTCRVNFANEMAEDYVDMATSYAASGQYKDALDFVNKALAVSGNDAEILQLKNTLVGILNPGFQSILTSANPYLHTVRNAYKQGNKTQVIEILKENVNKGNHWAAYILGNTYSNMNDYLNAIAYYQKALYLKPDFQPVYLSMASAQVYSTQYDAALKNLNTYLTYRPNSDTASALKAECLLNLKRYPEALDNINKALSISDNAEYRLIKGKILYSIGYYLEARDIFEKLVNTFPTAETYADLGLCQYKLKNYANALLNLDKAIILSDDDKNLRMKYNEVRMLLEKS